MCRYHDTIERYCDETDTWEIVGEMPTSRSSLSCVSLLLRKDIHMSSCPGTPNDNWLQVLGRWKAFTGYYMPRYWETTQGRVVNFLLKREAWVGHSSVRAESQFFNWWQLEGYIQKTTVSFYVFAKEKSCLNYMWSMTQYNYTRHDMNMFKVLMSEHFKSVKKFRAGIVYFCKDVMWCIYWGVISCWTEKWSYMLRPLQRICVNNNLNITCGKEACT